MGSCCSPNCYHLCAIHNPQTMHKGKKEAPQTQKRKLFSQLLCSIEGSMLLVSHWLMPAACLFSQHEKLTARSSLSLSSHTRVSLPLPSGLITSTRNDGSLFGINTTPILFMVFVFPRYGPYFWLFFKGRLVGIFARLA